MRQREATLHEQLSENSTDFERVSELNAQLQSVEAERQALEDEWLELAD